MRGAYLSRLRKTGWLEYDASMDDVLCLGKDKTIGVYKLPMVTGEVLRRQKGMECNIDNSSAYIDGFEEIDMDTLVLSQDLVQIKMGDFS